MTTVKCYKDRIVAGQTDIHRTGEGSETVDACSTVLQFLQVYSDPNDKAVSGCIFHFQVQFKELLQ